MLISFMLLILFFDPVGSRQWRGGTGTVHGDHKVVTLFLFFVLHTYLHSESNLRRSFQVNFSILNLESPFIFENMYIT